MNDFQITEDNFRVKFIPPRTVARTSLQKYEFVLYEILAFELYTKLTKQEKKNVRPMSSFRKEHLLRTTLMGVILDSPITEGFDRATLVKTVITEAVKQYPKHFAKRLR